jgi:hypothetical protein
VRALRLDVVPLGRRCRDAAMSDPDFLDFLRETAARVAEWPSWKRSALGIRRDREIDTVPVDAPAVGRDLASTTPEGE